VLTKLEKENLNFNDLSFLDWFWEIWYNLINKFNEWNKIIDLSSFSEDEYKILNTFIFNLDLQFQDNKNTKSFENLSAWEKMMLIRFTNIYMKILEDFEEWGKDFVILIDEPDLHLHLDWQKKYIQKLIDVFSTLDTDIKLHFIIATHSPFIISDLSSECIIVLDWSEKNKYWWKYSEIINNYEEKFWKKTFWANYVDIIRDWFFFWKDEALMGGFAESVIGRMADDERTSIMKWELKENDLKENIWDNFLKDNLLYFKGKKNDTKSAG
jgi:hypothetical protein